MDADAELDPTLCRRACTAFDHAVLHLDRATHRVDYAAKLDDEAVAGAFHNPAAMRGNGRVD